MRARAHVVRVRRISQDLPRFGQTSAKCLNSLTEMPPLKLSNASNSVLPTVGGGLRAQLDVQSLLTPLGGKTLAQSARSLLASMHPTMMVCFMTMILISISPGALSAKLSNAYMHLQALITGNMQPHKDTFSIARPHLRKSGVTQIQAWITFCHSKHFMFCKIPILAKTHFDECVLRRWMCSNFVPGL
jgi:hypothetical protein